MTKEYWITNSRFKLVFIMLVIMWIILIGFFYLKADEVTKDPCSVCAKQRGEEVTCYVKNQPVSRTYNPNFSITDSSGVIE